MEDKMHALEQNETHELISLPAGKKVVGCQWIYAIELNEPWWNFSLF